MAKFNSDHCCYCADLEETKVEIEDRKKYEEVTKDYRATPELIKIKRCKTESLHYKI